MKPDNTVIKAERVAGLEIVLDNKRTSHYERSAAIGLKIFYDS